MSADAGGRVLVVDEALPPRPRDGGAIRMARLLPALAALGWRVTAAAPGARPTPALTGAGVEVVGDSIEGHLRRLGARYDAVVLSRPAVASALLELVRRHASGAMLLYDTLDLHFVREFRQAKLSRSSGRLKLALQRKQQELALVEAADRTLVVSAHERELLLAECPDADVHVVSNVHDVVEGTPAFDRRRGAVFVGHFQHEPNVDGVVYLLEDVWPLVRAAAPIPLVIVGPEPPRRVRELAGDGVTVTGGVPDVAAYLDAARLSIAPLRFGAGVKGKVLESMGRGLPVAGSSVAFEGIDGYPAAPADDPHALARAVLDLHGTPAGWQRLADAGRRVVAREFSAAAAARALAGALARERAYA